MIVTIDGGCGCGKSYSTRIIAETLNWKQVHTGTLYRLMAYCFRNRSLDAQDIEGLHDCMTKIRDHIVLTDGMFLLDNAVISADTLDSQEIGLAATMYAQRPAVRDFAAKIIRHAVGSRDAVVEGRDCGTILFPNADHKFFLINDNHERQKENPVNEQIATLILRNTQDSERTVGALRPANDAVIIHVNSLSTIQEACRTIIRIVRSGMGQPQEDCPVNDNAFSFE